MYKSKAPSLKSNSKRIVTAAAKNDDDKKKMHIQNGKKCGAFNFGINTPTSDF